MLKKTISIFFIFLVVIQPGQAMQQQNPQLVFDQANEQFKKGNILQALKGYHSLEEHNHVSGALFLNMALNYIRLDSMGKAKYYFLRASRFEETKLEALKGLQFVENQFSHQSVVLPALPWQQALNWLEKVPGATTLMGIALILLNLGIFTFIATWFMRQSSRLLRRVAITISALGLVVILLSFYVDYRAQRYSKAVMVTTETKVRTQPEEEASIVNKAYEGYTFTVDHHKTKNHEQWTYVRMSNGLYGWIRSEEIMVL